MANMLVLYYSSWGHVEKMAYAQAEGVAKVEGILFGTPTRFGNLCAQMRNFLDQTGPLWAKNALLGKVGSVFTCTQSQHGGQETTITFFRTTLLHHGMIIAGIVRNLVAGRTGDRR